MNNINKPTIKIQYLNLKRWDKENSNHKSICPVCADGLLLMRRDPNCWNGSTFLISNKDNCISCGQSFIYTDIPDGELSFISDETISKLLKERRTLKLKRILNEM